jgi:hypothetical protein
MPTSSGDLPPWKRRMKTLFKSSSRSSLRSRNAAAGASNSSLPTTETTPLLRRFNRSRPTLQRAPSRREIRQHRFRLLLAMCLAFSLVAALGNVMLEIASVRLLEMSICRDHYRVHKPKLIGPPPLNYVEEYLCKIKDIETKLLDLRVLKGLIMIIPGI